MGEKQTLLERPENLITYIYPSDSFGPPALSPGGVRTSQPERADVEASIFLM